MALNVLESNALRDAARRANKEIMDGWTLGNLHGKPTKQKERDAIARTIIKKHAMALHPKFSLVQLVYMIGVVRGTLREPLQ